VVMRPRSTSPAKTSTPAPENRCRVRSMS
jgi:hypothetical protein